MFSVRVRRGSKGWECAEFISQIQECETVSVCASSWNNFPCLSFVLQTQNRMKLMADNYEDDHLKASSNSDQSNHKPSPDQVSEKQVQFQPPGALFPVPVINR